MAAKKQPITHEPLLSAVARKLGHAAGKVTNVTHGLLTHGLAGNVAALPATITTSVRKDANVGTPAKAAPVRIAHRRKKRARRADGSTKKRSSKKRPTKKTKRGGAKPPGSRD